MHSFRRSGTAALIYSEWAERLLRFFCLFVGNQPLAELLTIETVGEASRLKHQPSAGGLPVALIHRALELAIGARALDTLIDDPVVQAVRSLPIAQRTAVILFRGLGLNLSEIAEVTHSSLTETTRICADGLLAIHCFLTAPEKKNGRNNGAQRGDSQ